MVTVTISMSDIDYSFYQGLIDPVSKDKSKAIATIFNMARELDKVRRTNNNKDRIIIIQNDMIAELAGAMDQDTLIHLRQQLEEARNNNNVVLE